jgi:hypothetical protein
MYKPGDVVMVKDNNMPVTITIIVSGTGNIGYAGTYTDFYKGEPVVMEYGWIPHGLILKKLN